MINFTPFPKLSTARLNLRQLEKGDETDIFFLRSDKTVNQYVKRPQSKSIEDAIAFMNKINTGIQNNEWIYWVITLKDHPQMIGTITLWNISDDQKTAEVGYDLKPIFQGKGIMNEALEAVLQFGFQLGLEKIEAYTQWNNIASVKLLKKNSFEENSEKKDANNPDNLIFVLNKI